MKGKRRDGFLISLLGVLLLLIIIPLIGYTAAPQTINYQGYLTDSSGIPVNGTVQMRFSLYDVETGGTALWSETQTVIVNNGIYNVNLGAVNPINLPFDTQYYLGVQVGTDAEMVPRQPLTSVGYAFTADTLRGGAVSVDLSGNVRIHSIDSKYGATVATRRTVPYDGSYIVPGEPAGSFISGQYENYFTDSAGNSQKAYDIQGIVRNATDGSEEVALRFRLGFSYVGGLSDADEKMRITSAGNVGIGTISPTEKLEVEGNVKALGFITGDITFQKDGEKLWRMFEDEDGLYIENLKTGKVYRFVLREVGKK
jgi:hypothetical protein